MFTYDSSVDVCRKDGVVCDKGGMRRTLVVVDVGRSRKAEDGKRKRAGAVAVAEGDVQQEDSATLGSETQVPTHPARE